MNIKKYIIAILALQLFLIPISIEAAGELPQKAALVPSEAQTRLSSATLERGYTGTYIDGAVTIGVLGQKKITAATLEVKKKYDQAAARKIVPPPILQEFGSDIYEYSLKPFASADLAHLPLSLVVTSEAVRHSGIYFYDRNALAWRKLPSQKAENGKVSAQSPLPYAIFAVLRDIEMPQSTESIDQVRAAVVVDAQGSVLFSKNTDEELPIASLTKMMTVLVFLDHNPGWETVVTISSKDSAHPANLPVRPGDRMTVKDLFYVTLVGSRNNTSKALARSTKLSHEAFVAEMNAKAKTLGMLHSHFVEETGLHPGNQSTAEDYARLARASFGNPFVERASLTKSYTAHVLKTNRTYRITSTDKLLGGSLDVVGGKTGYTEEAGYALALKVRQKDAGYFVVVLGAPNSAVRFKAAETLARLALGRNVDVSKNKEPGT